MNNEKKINVNKIRIDGYATKEGDFYLKPPTGTFASGHYPELHPAYLIVNVKE